MSEPCTERLSSRWTFFFKFLFGPLWIGGFAAGTATLWIHAWLGDPGNAAPPGLRWGFLAATVLGSAFIYWSCIRLKEVRMDSRFLYLSNFSREIQVPLSQIVDVREFRLDNSHPITLTFSPPTEFGSRIVFMPRIRLIGLWSSHPVVGRLREAANLPPGRA